VIIPHQFQFQLQHRVVAEARTGVEAEAEAAAGAHPLEVEELSIRRMAEEVAEEDVVAAEEMVVDDPDHLQFIKVQGFLLDTFLPIYREAPVSWKNWINVC
jgi:hypothetical protein